MQRGTMSSKWCSNCKQIVTTNSKPNYCCWCGKDLRNEDILPEFNSWEERVKLVNELIEKDKILKTEQLKLF